MWLFASSQLFSFVLTTQASTNEKEEKFFGL